MLSKVSTQKRAHHLIQGEYCMCIEMATLTGGTIRLHSCVYISGAPQLFNISFPSAHAHTVETRRTASAAMTRAATRQGRKIIMDKKPLRHSTLDRHRNTLFQKMLIIAVLRENIEQLHAVARQTNTQLPDGRGERWASQRGILWSALCFWLNIFWSEGL